MGVSSNAGSFSFSHQWKKFNREYLVAGSSQGNETCHMCERMCCQNGESKIYYLNPLNQKESHFVFMSEKRSYK